jgi:alkylation response protein AidB-like acyl-CoA dehydrogenase
VRIDLPADHPARAAWRAFLQEHPAPSPRQLAEAGYVAPHWPAPYGLGADPLAQLVIDEELAAARISRPENVIGIGWAGPTLLAAGTKEQKERYLLPLLAGEELWCQLFSEPGAGSDLASLSTRAVRDGDSYIVSGQKLWTSLAHRASFGILLARTGPAEARRKNITYLICPMQSPGITIRPVIDMTGAHSFNEVFFDEVRIPLANRVGEEDAGWELAKVTLFNERVSLSGEGALWGRGPTAAGLVAALARSGGCADPVLRQEVARAYIEGEVLSALRLKGVAAAVAGKPTGPEASVRKALADAHGQFLMALLLRCSGQAGLLASPPAGPLGESLPFGFLFSPALTIGGGTAEVQRNIIAERLLGLPREIEGETGA